jgi:hypothetical protein
MAARVSQERPRSGFHPPKWTPGRRIGLNDEDRSLAIWASFGPGGSAKSWPRPRLWRERHGPPREKRARGWAVGHNVGARERWAARVETNSACFGLWANVQCLVNIVLLFSEVRLDNFMLNLKVYISVKIAPRCQNFQRKDE